MPLSNPLPLPEIASACISESHTSGACPSSSCCCCRCCFGLSNGIVPRLSFEASSFKPARSRTCAKQGHCSVAHTSVVTNHSSPRGKITAAPEHPSYLQSGTVSLSHGYGSRPHRIRHRNWPCYSYSTGMESSNKQVMWDHYLLEDSYADTLFLDAPFFPPHPEALDPFSQLLYQHPVGKNIQWWRFISFCRAHLHRIRIPRIKYSLVGERHTKVLLPASPGAAVAVPALSIGLSQDPFFMGLHRINAATDKFFGWFQQIGNRYGVSLLCLLVVGYWIQGFRCFPWLAMSFHLKDQLHVDPATLQFLQSTVNLPMVAKPVYGVISDAIYIGGARRMPYLLLAGALQTLSWSTVALHSGIQTSVVPLMGVLLVSNVGAAIAEVVNDALVAESTQKENWQAKGELQSFAWIALAMGGIVGNLTGGLALSRVNSSTMFAMFAIFVGAQLVISMVVKEKSLNLKDLKPLKSNMSMNNTSAVKMLRLQAEKLKALVSMPQIAEPLLWFAASYAVIPAMGGSLFFYQTHHLKISPAFLGLAKVMGQMGLLAGSLIYNRYLKKVSPRRVLTAVQILLSVCMLSDVLLVTRLNIRMGIPNELYVLGASAFVEAIGQFKVLPFTILLTELCPRGSEGSLLAFFMSCHCLATILSGYMGTILASFLRISADSTAGLPLGLVIQGLAALIPLVWMYWIPSKTNKLAFA